MKICIALIFLNAERNSKAYKFIINSWDCAIEDFRVICYSIYLQFTVYYQIKFVQICPKILNEISVWCVFLGILSKLVLNL